MYKSIIIAIFALVMTSCSKYKNNEIIWESLGFVEEAEVRKQLLK